MTLNASFRVIVVNETPIFGLWSNSFVWKIYSCSQSQTQPTFHLRKRETFKTQISVKHLMWPLAFFRPLGKIDLWHQWCGPPTTQACAMCKQAFIAPPSWSRYIRMNFVIAAALCHMSEHKNTTVKVSKHSIDINHHWQSWFSPLDRPYCFSFILHVLVPLSSNFFDGVVYNATKQKKY